MKWVRQQNSLSGFALSTLYLHIPTKLYLSLSVYVCRYHVTYSVDGGWGTLLENNSWTGVVGMLDRKEVDVSVTDLAITEARSQVIDYSRELMFLRCDV